MQNKKTIAFWLLLLLLPLAARGQRYEHKWEVALSVGGVPKTHFQEDMRTSTNPDAKYNVNPDLYEIYGDAVHTYIEPAWCTPSFTLEAGYSVKKWFKVSLEANYDHVVGKVLNEADSNELWRLSVDEISVIPKVRFYFGFTDYTCFYGGFGIGAVFRWGDGITPENGIKKVAPAFEIVPIGFTVGRKVFGFMELSFGNYMLGGRTGVGLRF